MYEVHRSSRADARKEEQRKKELEVTVLCLNSSSF
jgi:hypothetical protein